MEVGLVKIRIDGKEFQVKQGKNLLETCLSLGINIPHFCYQAALGSVGACRLCAVKKYKNAEDTKGRIVMSCMEPVAEGLIITTEDPESKAFREAVIEGLMLNHPHDCPVCDEGGECHLQDMTVMTGHAYRRTEFRKRTHVNQDLGPFINHEMNRCIQCYRCVRFYNDYAGGKDLAVFSAHDHVYFGRHKEGTLESEFSGNLAEVCPTGVFTDKTLKEHYTRKWDLSNAPSVCVHCSLGCNTIAGERYGLLRRIMNRYNGAVNGYFLCDRGRFGYGFVNGGSRLKNPVVRKGGTGTSGPVNMELLPDVIQKALSPKSRIIGIGSPRASLESNFALMQLVGHENFYHGVPDREFELVREAISILKSGPFRSPSLKEIEKADAVFILGEDLTNTAPMTALAVRQASRNRGIEKAVKAGIPSWNDAAVRELAQGEKCPVFIASPFSTKLDDIAEKTFRDSPSGIAELAFQVAGMIKNGKKGSAQQTGSAGRIADALKEADSPVIITGTHSGTVEFLRAAAEISKALELKGRKTALSIIVPWCNSMGLGMMDGKPLGEAIRIAGSGGADTLVVLENDLYRNASKVKTDLLFEKCRNVIALDHTENATTLKADIVLPVGTFAESEGTLVNNEGRAQRFYRVLPMEDHPVESWRQIRYMMDLTGRKEGSDWNTFDEVVFTMTEEILAFAPIRGHMPDADFRMLNDKIRRATLRFSGRTAILANVNVSEPKPPDDNDSPLRFSMEGSDEYPPASLVPFYWKPGWNSYQAVNFYLDEPNGSMKGGDPGIRLIEPVKEPIKEFTGTSSKAIENKRDEWMIIPVHRIFGSEELSAASAPVASRIPSPFVVMSPADAERSGSKENEKINLQIGELTLELKVVIDPSATPGILGIPAGFPGMPYLDLPAKGKK